MLLSADDVIDYFEEPWKWAPEYQIWDDADRPRPPSQDDLAEARMLGGGPAAHDLERRHSHDKQCWNAFLEVMEAYQNGGTPLVGLPAQDTAERNAL